MMNETISELRHKEMLMIQDYEIAIEMIKEIWPDQEKNPDLHQACDLVVYHIAKAIYKLKNDRLN